MGCCHICCTVTMLILFILVSVLTLYGIPTVLHMFISQQVSLEPGHITYDAWSQGAYPIQKSFYIFNIENPDEVNLGEKPKFREVGPFVFDVLRRKNDIKPDGEIITYTDEVWTLFNETATLSLNIKEKIQILNVPLLSIYYWAAENGRLEVVKTNKADIFPEGSELVLNVPVKNILMEGVKICGSNIVKPEVIEICESIKNIKMIFQHENEIRFALFKEKFNYEEKYVVNSGSIDIDKIGHVNKMNDEITLNIWPKTTVCNEIDSTLGDVFPPFIKKNRDIQLFRPDICRKISYSFKNKIPDDVKLLVFAAYLEKNPISCYCYDKNRCYEHGVVDMDKCWGSNMAMSLPYFYGASEKYLNAIESDKQPNADYHESRFQLDYYFGLLSKNNFKIQYNMNLRKELSLSYEEDILFPLLWTDEDSYIPIEKDEILDIVYYYLSFVYMGGYAVMGLFGLLFALLVVGKLCCVLWRC